MPVSPKGVGLPNCQTRTGNRVTIAIENTAGHFDDFSLRDPIGSG